MLHRCLQVHQPRGSSTNICAHLHSLLLYYVYIVAHKRNNCFTIFVCSFQRLGLHCLFSGEPVTFSCSSCMLCNIFLLFPGHCECNIVEALDFVIFLRRVLVFVSAGNELDWTQIANSASGAAMSSFILAGQLQACSGRHGSALTRGFTELMHRIQGSLSSVLSFHFPAARVSPSFIRWFFKPEKLWVFATPLDAPCSVSARADFELSSS